MTTETIPDPTIRDWSTDLEVDLVQAGMEPEQARAYRRAFEFGMNRVLSVVATRQELKDEIAAVRQEIKQAVAGLRSEMRFYMLLHLGFFGTLLGVILSKL